MRGARDRFRPSGRRHPARVLALIACAGISASAGGVARGNGAFPDAQNVLVPAALPHEIALGTNFGLVLSVDDGQSWTWSCEQANSSFASMYQMGAAPLNRLYAVAFLGTGAALVHSDDSGCSWSVAGGLMAGSNVADAFPDPTNSNRVLAIVAHPGDGGASDQLWESADGGTSFATMRYAAAAGDVLTGIEIARAAPSTLYLTMLNDSGGSFVAKLAQSVDGGGHWQLHDLNASLGAGITSVRIISVDPDDANKLFLRVALGAAGDEVALTTDGGATVSVPLVFSRGVVTAFARMATGSLVAAGIGGATNVDPIAFRSTDGGMTFQPLPPPPHLRGLAARGTTLYGVADNYNDGYAIGLSPDEGVTWQPLMSYDQVRAIASCVSGTCQADCFNRAALGQWSSDVCSIAPVVEGGSDASAAVHDAAASDARGDGGGGGCRCQAGVPTPAAPALALLVLLAGWLFVPRRH